MNSLNQLTIQEAKKGLRSKKFSSWELTNACLESIAKLNRQLNAFITVAKEYALKKATEADRKIVRGEDQPLLGIPIAAKDIYLTQGIKTTAASRVLENYIPTYSATVINKLEKAGAVLIGKTNLDAWAHGSSGENSDFGPTKNPWDLEKVPGGSSSGSAVAVSTSMALSAMGSDTGGSVRLPASFTNTVGLKPTYGRVSRYGVVAMASSLDSMGHFTKTVYDSALLLSVTAGFDENDSTSLAQEIPDYLKEISPKRKITIGVPKEYFSHGLNKEVRKKVEEAIDFFKKSGHPIVEVSLPLTKVALATYYIIMSSEVSSNLSRYDGIRFGHNRTKFGSEAKRRIMIGTYALSAGYYEAYYLKAMKVRTLIKQDFEEVFKKVDVVIGPVSPTLPFRIGERIDDPLSMYLADVLTVPINLAGLPALVLPCGFSRDNLPIGMQIIGPHLSEGLLFYMGYLYQQETDWHFRKPKK